MKTNPSHQTDERGSVLLVTMSILAVGLMALACYLMLVQAENNNVSRSQAWNTIISVSEAGIEEGLALVNQGYPSVVQNSWDWTNSTTNWTASNGTAFSLTRTVYSSNQYTVTVDISTGTPTITSVGTVAFTPVPWAFSANRGPLFAAAGMPILAAGTTSGGNTSSSTTSTTSSALGRKVQVQTVLSSLFSAAIVAKSNITFNGNNTLIDSFDSSTALGSTGGQYDVNKRRANGNAGTDSAIASLSFGNGNVYGKAMTGPGSQISAVNVGPQGAVGDLAWNTGGSHGIETGYWDGDLNVNITDVSAPAASASLPTNAPLYTNGVFYSSGYTNGIYYLTGGSYLSASDPSKPIVITGPVTLWVTTTYSPSITISNNNASLALYVGASTGTTTSLSLSGNNVINTPGYARNLQIYGLPSLTSITLSGNAAFTGTIYAPEATVTGNGGGSSAQDTTGAIIANSIVSHGHWNIHYDESLKTNGPSRGWIPKNWSELKYP